MGKRVRECAGGMKQISGVIRTDQYMVATHSSDRKAKGLAARRCRISETGQQAAVGAEQVCSSRRVRACIVPGSANEDAVIANDRHGRTESTVEYRCRVGENT